MMQGSTEQWGSRPHRQCRGTGVFVSTSRSLPRLFACSSLEQISKKVFDITNTLKNACVPLADDALIARNAATAAAVVAVLMVVSAGLGLVY